MSKQSWCILFKAGPDSEAAPPSWPCEMPAATLAKATAPADANKFLRSIFFFLQPIRTPRACEANRLSVERFDAFQNDRLKQCRFGPWFRASVGPPFAYGGFRCARPSRAGRGQAGRGQAGRGQAGRGQAGRGQAGRGQAGRGQGPARRQGTKDRSKNGCRRLALPPMRRYRDSAIRYRRIARKISTAESAGRSAATPFAVGCSI